MKHLLKIVLVILAVLVILSVVAIIRSSWSSAKADVYEKQLPSFEAEPAGASMPIECVDERGNAIPCKG